MEVREKVTVVLTMISFIILFAGACLIEQSVTDTELLRGALVAFAGVVGLIIVRVIA